MRARHKVALIASIVVGMTAITFSLLQPGEPYCEGKSLTEWLRIVDSGPISSHGRPDAYAEQDRAVEAIRTIGTNGVPALLKLVRARDSRAKDMLLGLLSKQSIIRIRLTKAADLNKAGMRGFQILGTNAQAAVPSLLADLRNKDEHMRDCAWALLTLVDYKGER